MRSSARGNLDSSVREKLGESRTKRPREVPGGDHLYGHVGAQAVADDAVAAEVGGELAREPGVVLHAEVVRGLGPAVPG